MMLLNQRGRWVLCWTTRDAGRRAQDGTRTACGRAARRVAPSAETDPEGGEASGDCSVERPSLHES